MKRSLLILAAISALTASPAAARTPPGFFGVVPQSHPSAADFHRMQGAAETVRINITWPAVEPQPGQWEFAATDAVIGAAAKRGIRVLPVLYGTPAWLTDEIAKPPTGSSRAGWRRFVRKVVERYGPGGPLWRQLPKRRPVRRWQVWNEPNFILFWRPRPQPRAYARLLRESSAVIRSVDPGATVIAAGIAPVAGGMSPWRFLRELYAVPGVRRSFDAAALHPYVSTVRGVELEVRLTRAVMAAGGDAETPLLISEIGIASGPGAAAGGRGARRQASFLTMALGMLAERRQRWRIAGVHWFAWEDGLGPYLHCSFCRYAGLVTHDRRPKPSLRALRRLVRESQLSPRPMLNAPHDLHQ
jgi:hypothetical protein